MFVLRNMIVEVYRESYSLWEVVIVNYVIQVANNKIIVLLNKC